MEPKKFLFVSGVAIIPQDNFTSFADAIAFVKANPNRYVIKPSGEAQNLKQLLFVGEDEDGKDVIQVLEDYQRAWADRIKAFQLQRRIVGVEVAAGAFFNGAEFVLPVNINFEHKEALPGDIGPSTGEMGTTMFWSEPTRIFNATRKKMEPRLRIEDVKTVNQEWVVTGTSGVVLIVVGLGPTMRAAQRQAYHRIENIMIPNMYYRKDIGDRWFEDLDRLRTWGYLRD